ncbi:hypothetical protein AAHC03_09936 [Spirometra sp. Aus1]
MTTEDIQQNLRTVSRLPNSTALDCHLEIFEEEYLTVRIDDERDPSECFDLRCIEDVFGLTGSRKDGGPASHMLVFRFRASELTNGECPDEVHIFKVDTEAKLKWAANTLEQAAENAK